MNLSRTIVFILSILLLIGIGCSKSGDLLYLEDPKQPELTPFQTRCVEMDDSQDNSIDLLSAIQKEDKAQQFARLYLGLAETDTISYLSLASTGNGQFTILLPTDQAFESFLQSHPEYANNRMAMDSVLKHHVLIERWPMRSLLGDPKQVHTMNQDQVGYAVDSDNCVDFDTEARLLKADHTASNGVIHLINQVLVP